MSFVKSYLTTSSSGVVALVLYDSEGTVVTVGAAERLLVTNFSLNSLFTQVTTLFSDNDDDNVLDTGEHLAVTATLLANTISDDHAFDGNPLHCGVGAQPHVSNAFAVATEITLAGRIVPVTIFSP